MNLETTAKVTKVGYIVREIFCLHAYQRDALFFLVYFRTCESRGAYH